MNQRIMNRPLVVEEERINFDDPAGDDPQAGDSGANAVKGGLTEKP